MKRSSKSFFSMNFKLKKKIYILETRKCYILINFLFLKIKYLKLDKYKVYALSFKYHLI